MPSPNSTPRCWRRWPSSGIDVAIDPMPNEIADAIPFERDTRARRLRSATTPAGFWRVLLRSTTSVSHFRTGFLGKVSPVHFFWGSFDLAVTRFSGRPCAAASRRRAALPDAVAREAYSHEVSSAGFWPGGGGIETPAFYSYAYPAPDGFASAQVRPAQALQQGARRIPAAL